MSEGTFSHVLAQMARIFEYLVTPSITQININMFVIYMRAGPSGKCTCIFGTADSKGPDHLYP